MPNSVSNDNNVARETTHRAWLLAAFVVLFCTFQWNMLDTASHRWFLEYNVGDQSFVVSAMTHAVTEGAETLGLGKYYPIGNWAPRAYEELSDGPKPGTSYRSYQSQFGLHGHVFAQMYRAFRFQTLLPYQSVNSALLSGVLVMMVAWVWREWGAASAIALFFGTVLSPWLIVSARNLYWMEWTWFLPMVLVGVAESYRSSRRTHALWYVVVWLAVTMKCLCTYEFWTTVVGASLVPVFYLSVRDGESAVVTARRLLAPSLAGLAAFATAFVVHSAARAETLAAGFGAGWSDAVRRSFGNVNTLPSDQAEIYAEAYSAPVGRVVRKYLLNWSQPAFTGVPLPFPVLLLALGLVAFWLWSGSDRKGRALGATFAFSVLAPISWMVLAKGYAYFHDHYSMMIWHLPTMLVAAAMVGYVFSSLTRRGTD